MTDETMAVADQSPAPATYTRDQVIAALLTTENRIYEAAGDPGADDVFQDLADALTGSLKGDGPFTRDEVTGPLNEAANELNEGHEYECSKTIWADSVADLTVNTMGYLLDHPGAELDEIIPAMWSDTEPMFCDLPEGAEKPAKGSDEWNAALTEEVIGWVS